MPTAVETFDLSTYDLDFEVVRERRAAATPRGNGISQARQTLSSVSRHTDKRERLVWSGLRSSASTFGEMARAKEIFERTAGGALPLSFVDPDDGETYIARILPGSFRWAQISASHFRWSLSLEEMI